MTSKVPFSLHSITPEVLRRMNMQDKRKLFLLLEKIPTPTRKVSQVYGREDPREFVKEVLGAQPTKEALAAGYSDPWTPDQEKVMMSVMQHRKTAVPSGHSAGKTKIAAWIALWFLYRHPNTTVVTTAPTARQVEEVLWGEIREAHASARIRLPGRVLLSKIDIGGKEKRWFATGFTVASRTDDISATSFQGLHNRWVLVVYDEATGVTPEVLEGGESLMVRPTDRALAIANPTDPTAWFKKACDTWHTVHMSCEDHPNVIHSNPDIVPGAVTQEWIDDRLEAYGSRDAPLFRSKVLGLFPDQNPDSLISVGWVERAQRFIEDEQEDDKGVSLGLDVAGEGEDLTVLWACKNRRTWIPKIDGRYAWHVGRDVMQAVSLVKRACMAIPDVRSIAVDDTGLGGGCTARLNEMNEAGELPQHRLGKSMSQIGRKLRILPVNFGSSAWNNTRFQYTKDELWWHGRELLRMDEVLIPSDAELSKYGLPKGNSLTSQLTTAIYDFPMGKIVVYDKRGARGAVEKTKLLPIKSPDLAHAWLLAVWARSQTPAREVPERMTTTQQMFDAQTQEIIEKGIEGKRRFMRSRVRGREMPYQRTLMSRHRRRR
jgi:hypothetical protein